MSTLITTQSEFVLQRLEVGVVVLIDKGFPQIEPGMNNKGSLLVTPSFKNAKQQK